MFIEQLQVLLLQHWDRHLLGIQYVIGCQFVVVTITSQQLQGFLFDHLAPSQQNAIAVGGSVFHQEFA